MGKEMGCERRSGALQPLLQSSCGGVHAAVCINHREAGLRPEHRSSTGPGGSHSARRWPASRGGAGGQLGRDTGRTKLRLRLAALGSLHQRREPWGMYLASRRS